MDFNAGLVVSLCRDNVGLCRDITTYLCLQALSWPCHNIGFVYAAFGL